MNRIVASVFAFFIVFSLFTTPVFSEGDFMESDDATISEAQEDTPTKDEIRAEKKAQIKALKVEREQKREEMKDKREEVRESAKTSREEFRERLAEIKDERKQKVVERIVGKLDTMGDRWTERWTKALDRMEELLVKIESRADKASEAGHDASGVTAAIIIANAKIATARAAIETQAGNEYVITITDESSLGSDISSVVQQLRSDLSAVRDTVKEARDAVKDALKSLKAIRGADTVEEIDSR